MAHQDEAPPVPDGEGEGNRRWLPALGVAAAAAAIAVVVALALTGGDDGDAGDRVPTSAGTVTDEPTGTDGTTVTEPETTEPDATATDDDGTDDGTTGTATPSRPDGEHVGGVPVYWVGPSQTRLWVYREFREVPDAGDPGTTAVQAMLTGEPLDPDYTNPWSPASRVEVTTDGDAVTVDLSADAFADTQVGSEAAAMAVQQLVYTVTAALQVPGPVTVLVDGETGFDAWGVISLDEPMTRDTDAQAQIWVDSPREGAAVPAGTVTVSGVGTAFEATLNWDVTDDTGTVVAEGFTTGGSMGTFAPYSFDVELEPGTYTVAVYAEDMSDGESAEGPRMFEDTKTFTVE